MQCSGSWYLVSLGGWVIELRHSIHWKLFITATLVYKEETLLLPLTFVFLGLVWVSDFLLTLWPYRLLNSKFHNKILWFETWIVCVCVCVCVCLCRGRWVGGYVNVEAQWGREPYFPLARWEKSSYWWMMHTSPHPHAPSEKRPLTFAAMTTSCWKRRWGRWLWMWKMRLRAIYSTHTHTHTHT